MVPAWNQLGKAYADSETVQIVDVDCTANGKNTCSRMGVQGFPTIKYFTAKTGKSGADYQGGRDYDALSSFVKKTLASGCNVKTGKDCAANEKQLIQKMKEKTLAELQDDITNKTALLKDLKKERSAAQAEMREKEKTWTRNEKNYNKALGILKQMEKLAKDGQKTEL
mmetsp:Transcript_9512/g.20989  ORF Transcript_9512/g.20989 Transcript_9512/m.20989 type:complete len:168 (-) Transcript_9512:199-702(-)